MKVTDKITMRAYDEHCKAKLRRKIPKWHYIGDYRMRVGDCVYDYSEGEPPSIRLSVHDERNRKRDLGGEYALLSTRFYYFGDKPVSLPRSLKPIVHAGQGHKSSANQRYLDEFVAWIEGYEPNNLYGKPQLRLEWSDDDDARAKCARRDLEDAESDELACE